MHKLFMVVNEDRFFLSHRKEIAIEAQNKGFDVTVVSKDTGETQKIKDLGFHTIDLPINPTGMNIKEEIKTLLFLFKLYKKNTPDIVHHVGLKNILWGGLAAKLSRVKSVVNAVSGLGGLFNGNKVSFISKCILLLMRFSNSRANTKVIFQNNDDLKIFVSYKVVKPTQISFIKGSGVNLNDFKFVPEPVDEPIKVIFTARMVVEKGVMELIDAAEKLKDRYKCKVQFLLCGRLTSNASGISQEYMKEHCDGEYIQWLGQRSDIHQLLEQSHIMAFPSYYREGVPKSLIEACAVGRPIVTCNSIGCKDVVTDGYNGYLIPVRDCVSLADKLQLLIDCKEMRQEMGRNARKVAERDFSIENVINTHMIIYNSLLS